MGVPGNLMPSLRDPWDLRSRLGHAVASRLDFVGTLSLVVECAVRFSRHSSRGVTLLVTGISRLSAFVQALKVVAIGAVVTFFSWYVSDLVFHYYVVQGTTIAISMHNWALLLSRWLLVGSVFMACWLFRLRMDWPWVVLFLAAIVDIFSRPAVAMGPSRYRDLLRMNSYFEYESRVVVFCLFALTYLTGILFFQVVFRQRDLSKGEKTPDA